MVGYDEFPAVSVVAHKPTHIVKQGTFHIQNTKILHSLFDDLSKFLLGMFSFRFDFIQIRMLKILFFNFKLNLFVYLY